MAQSNNLNQDDQGNSWLIKNSALIIALVTFFTAYAGDITKIFVKVFNNVVAPKQEHIICASAQLVTLQVVDGQLFISDQLSFRNSGSSPGTVHNVELSLTDTLLKQSFIFGIAFVLKGKSKMDFEAFNLGQDSLKNANLVFNCIDENFMALVQDRVYKLDLKVNLIDAPNPQVQSFYFSLSPRQFRRLRAGKKINVTLVEIN